MADSTQQDLVASVAREIVGEVAPRELALFRPLSQAYFKDPEKTLKGGGGSDKMLGFGSVAAVGALRTPLILRCTQTACDALTNGIIRQLDTELRRIESWVSDVRTRPAGAVTTEVAAAPSPAEALTPSNDLVEQVRLVIVQQLVQLGTGEPECSELASKVCSALATGKMAEELVGRTPIGQQVQQLTIQIDEVKRARDVEAVVNSDAFARIAERAAELRRQASRASATE